MFVFAIFRLRAAAATISATFQTAEACAAAGKSTTGASNNTPDNRQENQTADNADSNDGPSSTISSWTGAGSWKHELAIRSIHTVIPTGKAVLHARNLRTDTSA